MMETVKGNPFDPADTESVWLVSRQPSEEAAYEEWKAQFYAERGRKASEGMLARVREGWFAGPAPIGYLNDDTHERANIMLDPIRAPLVRETFGLVAGGMSLRRAMHEVTGKGLLARNGRPLTYSSFQMMVGNPFYYGRIRYQGELYPGRHEPLISKELFDLMQEKVRTRTPSPARRRMAQD